MARVAAEDGVRTIVATPHIRDDHPFDRAVLGPLTAELNHALRAEGVPVEVVAGGEVALSKAGELDDEALAALCLGGRYLLVESPYTPATDLLERELFELRVRGFLPVLAHPERSPSFQANPDRLAALVEGGFYASITADSLRGRFGGRIAKLSLELLRGGLVHDVASDAHGSAPGARRPRLGPAYHALARETRDAQALFHYLTHASPAAMLAGEQVPPPPRHEAQPRGFSFRRLFRSDSHEKELVL